jgi:hypothetical protein
MFQVAQRVTVGAPRIVDGAGLSDTQALAMNAESLGGKTQKLLFDEAGPAAGRPLSTSVGEIAALYDIPPTDALDAVIGAGCKRYWWEGNRYDAGGVRRLVKEWSRWDATPEVEVDLTPEQRQRLDQALGEENPAVAAPAQELQKPIRKFAASETALHIGAETARREKLG